jgi:hypothetical protein
LPSRTRADKFGRAEELRTLGVGDELSVQGVGDPALEAAQRFERGLACRSLASVVRQPWGVETDLADRDRIAV